MADLRGLLQSHTSSTSLQNERRNASQTYASTTSTTLGATSGGEHFSSISSDLVAAISKARRTLSLKPIFKKDVDLQYRSSESVISEHDAMIAAVKDYLYYELKYRTNVPNIVRVFPPANSPNFDRLYVEFESEYDADYIASFARFIKKPDHQVSIYVPRGFQQRFRAFNLQARLIRTAEGLSPGDVKTKIRYDRVDFCLLSKRKNSPWSVVHFDKSILPPLECITTPVDQNSFSPPPGRPTESAVAATNRKRAASSSLIDFSKKPSKLASQTGKLEHNSSDNSDKEVSTSISGPHNDSIISEINENLN